MEGVKLVKKILKTNHKCNDGNERADIVRYIELPNGSSIYVNFVHDDGVYKFDAVAEVINTRKE